MEQLYCDDAFDPRCVNRLVNLVKDTDAKVILSSSWRCIPQALKLVMDELAKHDVFLYSITEEGIFFDRFKNTPWQDIEPCLKIYQKQEKNFDRGAEIAAWLMDNATEDEPISFVILDDETIDITNYFPNNFVRTLFSKGLTDSDVDAAKMVLETVKPFSLK
jgi:hypothetical protein